METIEDYIEELKDNPNTVIAIGALLSVIALGIAGDWLLDYMFDGHTLRGAVTIVTIFLAMLLVGMLLKGAQRDIAVTEKEARQEEIEQWKSVARETMVKASTIDSLEAYSQQIEHINGKLAKEVELLRKAERERIAKIEKAGAEIEKGKAEIEKHQAEYRKAVADYEKAKEEIEKGCAQIKKLEAEIEKGKADNQKAKQSFEALLSEHQPIINLGLTYIDYRVNKSLNASNSLPEKERAEAKVAFDYAKGKLDDFMTNYKTN